MQSIISVSVSNKEMRHKSIFQSLFGFIDQYFISDRKKNACLEF